MLLTPQFIIKTVCDHFHQEEADVLSTSQERKFIVPPAVFNVLHEGTYR